MIGVAEDGSTLAISVDDEHRHRLEAVWPPVGLECRRASCRPPAARLQVDAGDELGWRRVESRLALFAAEHLVGRVAVHAALVLVGETAIVLPGPSFAGKSTLCGALGELGARILSDEYALIDPGSGRATGWARPRRRRRADGGVDVVTIDHHPHPVAIGLVAELAFDPDAPAGAPARWRSTTEHDRVRALLANAVSARSAPDPALDAALAVARSSAGVRGVRGPADEAAAALLARRW